MVVVVSRRCIAYMFIVTFFWLRPSFRQWRSDLGWSGQILPFVRRFDDAIRKRVPAVLDETVEGGGGKMLVLGYHIPGDDDEDVTVEGIWRLKRDESILSSQLMDSLWLHITTNHQARYNHGEADNTSSLAFGWDNEQHASIKEKEKSGKMKHVQSPASRAHKKRPCFKQSGLDPTKRKGNSRLSISP